MGIINSMGIVFLFALLMLICCTFGGTAFSDLLENKRLFKHIFKIQKPILVKEIFQILVIIILSIITLFSLWLDVIVIKQSFFCSNAPMCGGGECGRAYKTAMSNLNQAISLEKKLEGQISYNTVQDYATIFTKRFVLIDLKYLDAGKFEYSEYTKKQIKERNVQDFINKPIFTDARGYVYMFKKFGNFCKTVDIDNIENSDCVMVVDFNGKSKPNELTDDFENKRRPRDRYFLIIDGNKDVLIPPKMYHWYIFP